MSGRHPALQTRSLRDVILGIPGCIGLYMGDETSGARASDLTGTNQGVWTGTPLRGQPTVTPGDQSPSFVSNAPGNFILTKASVNIGALANSSILAATKAPIGATAAAGMAVYCERGSAGNAIWKLEWTGDPASRVRLTHRNDAGTLTQTVGTQTTSLVDGRPHIIGLSKAGTAIRHFRDGFDGTATLGENDTLSGATVESRIGSDKGDAAAFFRYWIGFVALWNRTITDGEAMLVTHYALGR